MDFVQSFAVGTVKENGVAIGFPNGGELHAARSVQAKEDAAGKSTTDEDSFSGWKYVRLQFVVVANGLVNIGSQRIQILD